jgi:hypothetical protein
VAQAEVTVINPSNKASPATVFAMAYKDALGEGTKFYQSQTCEDAQKTFDTTKNSVMIYNSSIEFAARDKGLNCKLEGVNISKVIYVGKQYMSVCTLKGSGKSFKDEKVTMGMPSMYSTKLHEEDYRANKINMTLVPYGGSKDIITALLNKDITHGFIATSMASKVKEFDCGYSTNPKDSNYIGNTLQLKVPDFRVTYVVYTNSSDEAVVNQLRNVETNSQFNEFLATTGTISDWKVTMADINKVIEYVNTLVKNWSSTKHQSWWL